MEGMHVVSDASPCTCDLRERADEVLSRFPVERGQLIPILQALQDELGYLPPDAMRATARFLNVPDSVVYGVVTFYAQFYLTPQGRNKVRVCTGTACHVRGSAEIIDAVRDKLGIGPGETTADHEVTLERVACLGSCALAPVMVVNDRIHGAVKPTDVQRLLQELVAEDGTGGPER